MFKLLFKPIKWILSIVLFFVILISIPLILLYKPAKKPETSNNTLILEEYIKDEIDNFIDIDNNDKRLGLLLNEDLINSEIENQLTNQFGESDNPDYLFEDENVMFQGVWVNIKEDTFNIVAGVHANARVLTYKTTVLISFKIKDQKDGTIVLKLNKFKIGHLSFKWAIKYSPRIIKQFLGQDIDSFIEDALGGIGNYNSDKMELEVDLYNLTNNVEDNKEMLVLLLDLIYENELLDIGVIKHNDEYKFGASFDLNKLVDESNNFKLNASDKIQDNDEFSEFLQNKALSSFMSGKSEIKFSSLEMNKIIDFIFNQGENLTNDYLMKTPAYEDYEITILNPYIEINGNNLSLLVPVTFGKGLDLFKTKFKLDVTLETLGDDLKIELANISLGELNIDNEKIKTILELTEVDGIDGSSIVVNDFFLPFKDSGVDINEIAVKDGNILFKFDGISVSNILDEINDEINNPDLNNKVDELLDKINNDEEITENDIDELFDIISQLDEEDIDKIQDIIGNLIP